jgi:hypothetical protein
MAACSLLVIILKLVIFTFVASLMLEKIDGIV